MASKLSAWDFKKYEELFTDELIEEAINELLKNYSQMAKWLKENTDYYKCKKCGSEVLYYRHDGILCNECDYIEKIKVPYPVKGGVVTSRKLTSCIKQIFGSRMGQARKNEKPNELDLRNLEYAIDRFDTGEYTEPEAKLLQQRFNKLMKQNQNGDNGADPIMIRSMVIKELQIQNIERQEAAGIEVDRMKAKDIYKIYMDLSGKLKFTKNTRENQEEESAFSSLQQVDVDEELEKYIEQLKEIEKHKKISKERKMEVGNPFG